jgi:hypothetical protein
MRTFARVVVRSLVRFLGPALIGLAGLSGQAVKPVMVWPQPTPIPYQTPLTSLQLDATTLSAAPVQVPLTGVANIEGITTPGYRFLGGFDYDSWAYAEELIGSSITWQGIPFAVGPANENDVLSSATVPLPTGAYGTLLMLGDMVNNISPSIETFTVTYTDGTTKSVQQGMSDWVNPRNYPGETVVQCYPWRHNLDGTNDQNSVCAYGYSITLDPSKTVASLTLPNSRDIVMISFVLVPPVVQGTTTYNPAAGAVLPSGTQTLNASFTPANAAAYTSAMAQVPLTVTPLAAPITPTIEWATPAPIVVGTPLSSVQLDAQAEVPNGPVMLPIVPESRVDAIYEDGSHFNETGFDGTSIAYSANQLGSSLRYAGFTFALGPLAVPDAATSATIPVPPGSYSTLYLVGAGANGAQVNQPFTINYADGTTSVADVSMSSWNDPESYPGETVVAQTSYADTSTGGSVSGTYDVYGYQAPVDATRIATSVTMPPNSNVILLALGIGAGGTAPVDGNYVYNPPTGTVLPLGVNPLAVSFVPADTIDVGPTTGSTTITVVKPTLTVTANDARKVYGTENPTLTGSIMGANPGDTFTESFSTTATMTSNAGAYLISPAAEGNDLSAYQVVTVPGTLTVTQAPVNVTASESATGEIQGQPLTLTANVQSTTTGTPTGTVQFVSDGTVVGTAPLVNGSATLMTGALAVGSDTVTAVYSGDLNFLSGTASTGPTIVVTSADFTFTAPQGLVITDTWGKTATLMLNVTPMSTIYYGTISFSLGTGLPPSGTASFGPATIAPNAGPQDIAFTYNSKLLSKRQDGPLGWHLPLTPMVCGLLLLPLAASKRLRRARGMNLLMILLLAATIVPVLSGCGSGYRSGSYPLVVTATDGMHTHSLTLTLDLQAP